MRERDGNLTRPWIALGLAGFLVMGACSDDQRSLAGGDAGADGASPSCPSQPRPDRCGSVCVSLATDPRHCGSCERACPGGASCVAGECDCPASAPDSCGEACTDITRDPRNCGACNDSCEGFCREGACAGVSSLSLGGQHTVVVMSDGTLAGFGYNGFGQLGEGLSQAEASATVLPAPLEVTHVSAGRSHTCGCAGGKVLCFGDNAFGQLGEETRPSSPTPVEIAVIEPATQVAAGGRHGCALTGEGSVSCWGWNANGQLGDGTTEPLRTTPVAVTELAQTQVQEISAGGLHTCARTDDGAVYCWGDNAHGQLGDGTRTRSPSPVSPVDLPAATEVRAGGALTCALLVDATVSCWGGSSASAPDAAVSGTLVPTPVVGVEGATAIAVGRAHACAVVGGGAVRCWGEGYGDPARSDGDASSELDAGVVDVSGITSATSIEAGDDHTCILVRGGEVWCWGQNAQGQLGRGQQEPGVGAPAVVTWR